jgi:hypothetical protein
VDEQDDAAIEAKLARVTPDRWAEIETALDAVEAAGAPYASWSSSEPHFPGDAHHFPFPIYTDAVRALIHTLGGEDLLVFFDWMNWPGFTDRWPAERFASGSVADAARLVTTAMRGERFSDGFIESLLIGGVLQAAVRRLLDARPTRD